MEKHVFERKVLKSVKLRSILPNFIPTILLVLFLLGSATAMAGRCTGSADCTACTTCSSCEYCNSGGGTCGVCSIGSSNATDSGGGLFDGLPDNWLPWTVGIAVGGYLFLRIFRR